MPAPEPLQQGEFRRLGRLEDIADGCSRGFDPLGEGRDTMFVVRIGEGVVAYRNACPHYDFARMAWRKDEFLTGDRTQIRCAAHGALFRLTDGVCEQGPCLGAALTPAPVSLVDGTLQLNGPWAPGLRQNQRLVGAEP